MGLSSLTTGAMRTDTNRLINADAIEEHTLKPVVKFLLVAGALFLLWGLASALPGIDRLIPTTSVTLGTAIGAAFTLVLVAVLAHVALRIEPVIAQAVAGPTTVARDLASLVKHLLLFAAVLVAHRGFEPLIEPELAAVDLAWTYDLTFLALALVPTTVVVIRLFNNVDEVSSRLTDRLTAPSSGADDR
jgi:hypothetical protein